MKPKESTFIEEIDIEVVNRQPNAQERREISAFIRADKAKAKRLANSQENPPVKAVPK